MKTRKTKKRNIIRRTVAFLLCMTMVLGLGMQDVIEQVYAEEAIPVIEQEAATEEAGELTTEGAAPEENAETAEEPDESVEEAEEQSANSTPSQPADAEENTKTDVPSAPAENAGSEEGEKQNPSAPAEDGQSGSDSETSAETNPGGNTGNEITAPAEDGNTVTNPDETTGEDTEDDAAVSDEEEETAELEEDQEPAEEEAQVYDKEETVGNVTIHVYAEAGVLPEDAELSVTPIEKKEITEDMSEEEKAEAEEINAQYEETEQKLKEDVESETEAAMDDAAVNAVNTISAENAETDETAGKTLEGFLAYDISFLVKDENEEKAEIEPEGEVKVSFEFDEAVIPEGVSEGAEVAVKHLKEDENAEGGIVVEDVTENAEVTINESAAVEAMSLTTDSFSIFTITWVQKGEDAFDSFTTDIHVVTSYADGYYSLGNGNLPNKAITSTGTPPTLYIDTISESGANKDLYSIQVNQNEYRFVQAFIATQSEYKYELVHSEPIEALQALEYKNVRYKLENAGEYQRLDSGQVVIFVYTSDSTTTTASYYSTDGERINEQSFYNFINISSRGENGTQVINGSRPTNAWNGRYGSIQYVYDHTVIIKGGQTIEPTYMRYFDDRLQYSLSEVGSSASEREWIDVGFAEIRLVYKETSEKSTVDTSGVVDISLTDLNVNDSSTSLAFNSGNGPLGDQSQGVWNKWTGHTEYTLGNWPWEQTYNAKNLAVQGIVEDELYVNNSTISSGKDNYTGYPKLVNRTGSDWLEPLFNNETTITGLNHLFQKDGEGYYYYDSSKNYAYLNKGDDNRNFKVYSTPGYKGNDQTGDFMPFNDIDDDKGNNNFEFSMNIGFNFTQPENGKINDNPMVFEFSGDDDVWVFIDGKLVLDIGGIHDAISGSINFATGVVKVVAGSATSYNGVPTKYAGQTYALDLDGDEPKYTVTSLKKIFGLEGDTFEDGTTHRLEFFYLERGRGESNCSLKFNLQPQESGTLTVEKEITNTDRWKYANVNFSFKVYLEDAEGSNTYHVMPENTPYTIMEDGQIVGEGTVGEYGLFQLKHGQSAVFSDISPSLRYRVEEVSVDSDEFDKVTVNGKAATYYDSDDKEVEINDDLITGGQEFIASTEDLLLGEVAKVKFSNQCSGQNKNELQITKVVDGNVETDDRFTFRVEFENLDGQLEGYSGNYYLVQIGDDGEKTYYKYSNNGDLVVSEKEKPAGSTEDGSIGNIPAGYTVIITDLLSGTDFKVSELNLNTEKYLGEYTVSVVSGTCDDPDVYGANGKIKLGTNAKVTVTNYLKNQITVTKEWNTVGNVQLPEKIYVGLYKENVAVSDRYIELTQDGQWTETFVGVGGADYSVKELRPVEGDEEAEFTIDGKEYIGVDNGNRISINNRQYTVNYTRPALIEGSETQWETTITNTQSWQIIKRSSSESNPALEGAKFTLTGPKNSGSNITLTGTSEDGGVITWTQGDEPYKDVLEDGEYTLTETQAPAGYSIGASWTIQITNGIPTSVVLANGSSNNDNIGKGEGTSVLNGDLEFWNEAGVLTLYYDDDALYDLPEAGGPGIHLYMLGGTLLMMAGALLVYKKRKEEVLGG